MAVAQSRDIVVIGASAGGLDPVREILSHLSAGFPATVLIAIHGADGRRATPPEVFNPAGQLPVAYALHGQVLEPGRVLIAPGDNHLTVSPGYVNVVRGPKENGHRPSVDALFRTAAAAYGPRVVGIVLSGRLDCGTAGLLSIKARGGLAVVQSPEEADAPEMPLSALKHVHVDYVARRADIAPLLERVCRDPVRVQPAQLAPTVGQLERDEPGSTVALVCPACSGSLVEVQVGETPWYRCHVGHRFSLSSLVDEQQDAMERALWAGVRALEESASLARRVALKSIGNLRERFFERETSLLHQADVLRDLLLHGRPTVAPAGVLPETLPDALD